MADLLSTSPQIDVAIIGGGPSGLAAATALMRAGISRVVVLEREAKAGGIPRHCGHPPFGMREFHRILKGPDYTRKLVETAQAAGVEIHTLTTVAEARPDGALLVATPEGLAEIKARRVIWATGVRETPRAARLISGDRTGGVLNTGALQSLVYLKGARPFERPVIVGTELVAFSAIATCKHAGIKPQAMIEPNAGTTARWPTGIYPRLNRIPLHFSTKLEAIHGKGRVTGVTLRGPDGKSREISCDGVILCGQFTPEASLGRMGHLEIDPASGGPVIDQYYRCSDPSYFATGNLLRPVETAGWSWREGVDCAQAVVKALKGELPPPVGTVNILLSDPRLKYVVPQRLALPLSAPTIKALQLRVSEPVQGKLRIMCGDTKIYAGALNTRPERRIQIPLGKLEGATAALSIHLTPENPKQPIATAL